MKQKPALRSEPLQLPNAKDWFSTHMTGVKRFPFNNFTRINHEKRSVDSAGLNLPISHFHYAYEFTTQILEYMLDSLVRVTRRAE